MEREDERWVRELEAAGWKRWRNRLTVWQSPNGYFYRGPFGAWRVMRGALLPQPLAGPGGRPR